MNQIHSVCVYSASSTKIAPVYFEAAEKLGSLLAKQHIRLINGAGSIGLMRSVADAVLKNGGEVTGVIPHFMVEQNWHHMYACRLPFGFALGRQQTDFRITACPVAHAVKP